MKKKIGALVKEIKEKKKEIKYEACNENQREKEKYKKIIDGKAFRGNQREKKREIKKEIKIVDLVKEIIEK